jgi:uncharacterized protein
MGPMLPSSEHRPWPLPSGPWIMAQRWHDLLFAHWPVDAARLRTAIPSGLALDTYEGRAWLGVIPFHMSGVRVRGLPPLPGTSAFAELNVRTYVTAGGKPGVLFFSLDAASRLAVEAARLTYHLPYFQAAMSVSGDESGVRYRSRRIDRRGAAAELQGRYAPTGPAAVPRPGSLEHFLTERYCLYTTDGHGRLRRGEIHHAPWPLQPAEAALEVNTMAAGLGFPLAEPPVHLCFARRLDVVFWPLRAGA